MIQSQLIYFSLALFIATASFFWILRIRKNGVKNYSDGHIRTALSIFSLGLFFIGIGALYFYGVSESGFFVMILFGTSGAGLFIATFRMKINMLEHNVENFTNTDGLYPSVKEIEKLTPKYLKKYVSPYFIKDTFFRDPYKDSFDWNPEPKDTETDKN